MDTVCENCRRPYTIGDKYCRFCGAPTGTPIYIEEIFAAIYGPPPIDDPLDDLLGAWSKTEEPTDTFNDEWKG